MSTIPTEFILTYQYKKKFGFQPMLWLDMDEEDFISPTTVLAKLARVINFDTAKLVKVSMCVQCEVMPQWYDDDNGKIYIDF